MSLVDLSTKPGQRLEVEHGAKKRRSLSGHVTDERECESAWNHVIEPGLLVSVSCGLYQVDIVSLVVDAAINDLPAVAVDTNHITEGVRTIGGS